MAAECGCPESLRPLTYLADVYRLYLKRGLSRTGRRTETDVVHAKVYTNFHKRTKGCTIPILADKMLARSAWERIVLAAFTLIACSPRTCCARTGGAGMARLYRILCCVLDYVSRTCWGDGFST